MNAGTYYSSAPNANNRTLVRTKNEQRELVTQFMGIADYSMKPDHNIILRFLSWALEQIRRVTLQSAPPPLADKRIGYQTRCQDRTTI